MGIMSKSLVIKRYKTLRETKAESVAIKLTAEKTGLSKSEVAEIVGITKPAKQSTDVKVARASWLDSVGA